MESLKKNQDFRNIYREGKSIATKTFVLYYRKNNLKKNRLGISVSKKVGNSVIRHRVRRLVKEAYRLQEKGFGLGYDFIVVARVRAKDVNYEEAFDFFHQTLPKIFVSPEKK
jgi:ribonuclease P protein component